MSLLNNSRQDLIREIEGALEEVIFGSVEIYVQDSKVTQITVRNIKKTSIDIAESNQNQVMKNKNQNVFTIHTILKGQNDLKHKTES